MSSKLDKVDQFLAMEQILTDNQYQSQPWIQLCLLLHCFPFPDTAAQSDSNVSFIARSRSKYQVKARRQEILCRQRHTKTLSPWKRRLCSQVWARQRICWDGASFRKCTASLDLNWFLQPLSVSSSTSTSPCRTSSSIASPHKSYSQYCLS